MLFISHFEIKENYIDPLLNYHPAFQYIEKAVVAIVKIIAAKILIELVAQTFLYPKAPRNIKDIQSSILTAPLREEIIFRGILQRFFRFAQSEWNHWRGIEPDESTKLNQKIFRIQIVAMLFGLVHFVNLGKKKQKLTGTIVQIIWAYLGGVADGHIAEKYSLSSSILEHSLNNTLIMACRYYDDPYNLCFFLAIFVNRIAIYILFVPEAYDMCWIAAWNVSHAMEFVLFKPFLSPDDICHTVAWSVSQVAQLFVFSPVILASDVGD